MTAPALLRLDGVTRRYGRITALDQIDLAVEPGEVLALVGESGSGKSTLARLAVGLERPDAGRVDFAGRRPSMVFQDPGGSLDPRWSAGSSIAEPLRIAGTRGRRARVERLAEMVGIEPGALKRRPHAFSGGQRQRIAIARALALEPDLLVLDEPLSALDVSVQAQILDLLLGLRRDRELAYLFISHDLAVVEAIATRVAVLFAGRVVEIGSRDNVFDRPRHPYTRALLAATPRLGAKRTPVGAAEPPVQAGRWLDACAYAPRCLQAADLCRTRMPRLEAADSGSLTACHFRNVP